MTDASKSISAVFFFPNKPCLTSTGSQPKPTNKFFKPALFLVKSIGDHSNLTPFSNKSNHAYL